MRQMPTAEVRLITEGRRILASRTGSPAVRLRTETVAVEFGCGGTSRGGGSGLTGPGIRGMSDNSVSTKPVAGLTGPGIRGMSDNSVSTKSVAGSTGR
jgi:hypothetical protein